MSPPVQAAVCRGAGVLCGDGKAMADYWPIFSLHRLSLVTMHHGERSEEDGREEAPGDGPHFEQDGFLVFAQSSAKGWYSI